MKTFREFLREARSGKTLYFCWGRFDPPTLGHAHLFNQWKVQATTNGADEWLIFPTRKPDYKKSFLTFEEKYKFLTELNPRFANKIIDDPECNTVPNLILKYEKLGYSDFVLIAGDEDALGYEQMARSINKDPIYKEKFSAFTFQVPIIPELKRKEGSGISGMSSSKLKDIISKGDKETFVASYGTGNENIANEIWDILEPYSTQLNKYVISKQKLKDNKKSQI